MRRLVLVPALVAVLGGVPAHGEEATYVGDEACDACHEEVFAPYAQTVHGKLFKPEAAHKEAMRQGCEGCHGPGSIHSASDDGSDLGGMVTFRAGDTASIRVENAVCLSCHDGGGRRHWDGSTHDMRDVACSGCHQVMHNASGRNLLAKRTEVETCGQCHSLQTSKVWRNAHMPLRPEHIPDRGEKMSCSSCHVPHGSVADSNLARNTVNETCYECHADKRGPFLWEHAPVAENCLNCHSPHGSTRPYMLSQTPPRLCQQCHVETRHPTDPYRPENRFVIGTACLQCHVNIHGSNHPSGAAYTR
jgi:DmsE family decaheme c-type cytochrome